MKLMILDTETSISNTVHGPDFREPPNDIYTIIYGSKPDNVVINHNAAGFKRRLPEDCAKILLQCDYLVGHNLEFDLSYLWKDGAINGYVKTGGRIWDTQVAEYILTAQQHQFSSLAELQEKYLGQKGKLDRISYLFKKGIGADKIVKNARRLPRLFKLYEDYCKLDGVTTLKIFKAQYLKAKKLGMLPIVQLYQDYLLGLINATNTGIVLDVNRCEHTLTEFNLKHLEYLEKAQSCIKKLWDNPRLPEFNINSPIHKSALLFGGEVKNTIRTKVGKYKNGNDKYANVVHKIWVEGFGLSKKLTRATRTPGQYVTDNSVMVKVEAATTNPLLKKYCAYQKEAMMYKKNASTYCQAFLDMNVEGILYPNFNNTGVVTGRISSSKPNLQNVSKRNKFGKPLHKLFIAPVGWKAIQIDFGQLEIWVSALLSNDKQLISDLLSGIDMHCMRVSHMEGCSYGHAFKMCKEVQDKYWASKRVAAKTFSYQRAYGCGIKKLMEFTGLDKEVLERLIAAEEERYPEASTLWEKVSESIKKTTRFSKAINKPLKQRTTKNTKNGYNLLQIFDKFGNVYYNDNHIEKIGYWKSITSKVYHFAYTGNETKYGIRESVSPTVMKNYPMQGTAADIQGATTAEILPLLLKHPDKIKMINEVHDSKWFYIKEEYLSQIIPVLRGKIEDVGSIFKKRFGIDVPFKFPVDVEVGDDFAEMHNYTGEEQNVINN